MQACSLDNEEVDFMRKLDVPSLENVLVKRTEIFAVLDSYDACDLRVFGSVARGEASLNSDIDFLVKFNNRVSILDRMCMEEELERILGFDVDVVAVSSLTPSFLHILDEAVSL